MWVHVDRKRKICATVLLRALGFGSDVAIRDVFGDDERMINATIEKDTAHSEQDGLIELYRKLRPGEVPTDESVRQHLHNLFFDPRRYDVVKVGRYKFNKKLNIAYRLPGCIAAEDIVDPATGELIVSKEEKISEAKAKEIQNAGINVVEVLVSDEKAGRITHRIIGNNTVDFSALSDQQPEELRAAAHRLLSQLRVLGRDRRRLRQRGRRDGRRVLPRPHQRGVSSPPKPSPRTTKRRRSARTAKSAARTASSSSPPASSSTRSSAARSEHHRGGEEDHPPARRKAQSPPHHGRRRRRRRVDQPRPALRHRHGRQHRPPRQPPRALRRGAAAEPAARGHRPPRAPHQGAHGDAGPQRGHALRPDQRAPRLRGHPRVLRFFAAVAVHGPDQPDRRADAQAQAVRARPRGSQPRARDLRRPRRSPQPLRPPLPHRDARRPEHRPHLLARDLRQGQRVRLHHVAVPPRAQGGLRRARPSLRHPRHRRGRLPDRGRRG